MTASPRRLAAVLVAGTLMVLATGCTTYSAKLKDLRPEIAAGSYDEALLTVEKETGSKDVLLAFLERGVILHRAGRYQESNEAFAAAERTAEELYARSISEGALSLISNDNAISYRARPFEMAMVPYFRALNYLHLGLRDDAMVEARKTSLMLSKYIDATIAGIERGDTDQLARTKNDPFMLYFSGMLYDWDGELNDAFIAYRNAATAYQDVSRLLGLEIPPALGWDLERVSRRLGFGAELAQLRKVCPDVFAAAGQAPVAPPGSGEVVLLVELGWVAAKHEERLDLPIFESDAYNDNAYWAWELTARAGTTYAIVDGYKIKYWLTVAVPAMETRPAATRRVRVRTAALPGAAVGSRVHQPSRNASITFEAEYGMILFKTILRGLTKYLATQEANKQNEVVGFLANLLGVATETADTRSWLLLPDHVQLVRLQLPAGVHDLELELLDGSGRPRGTVTIPGVTVRTGDWTFVNQRIYPR
jgi:hypothetical protein